MSGVTVQQPLTGRGCAILRAVAEGRVEMSGSSEPDLFINGLCLFDQQTTHRLVHRSLIAPSATCNPRRCVLARLTSVGAAIVASTTGLASLGNVAGFLLWLTRNRAESGRATPAQASTPTPMRRIFDVWIESTSITSTKQPVFSDCLVDGVLTRSSSI